MARYLQANEHYEYGGAIISNVPLTLAAWAWEENMPTRKKARLIGISDNTANNNFLYLEVETDTAGDVLGTMHGNDAGTINSAKHTAGSYGTQTWFHLAGTLNASGHAEVFHNGSSVATATGNTLSFANLNVTHLGAHETATQIFDDQNDMYAAEAAAWNVQLSDDEIASLAAGFSPLLVRPDALVAYWPLGGKYDGGEGNALDIFGGFTGTESGTITEVDHPPKIIYPAQPIYGLAAPAAASNPKGPLGQVVFAGPFGGPI